jgi:hypothetical protein
MRPPSISTGTSRARGPVDGDAAASTRAPEDAVHALNGLVQEQGAGDLAKLLFERVLRAGTLNVNIVLSGRDAAKNSNTLFVCSFGVIRLGANAEQRSLGVNVTSTGIRLAPEAGVDAPTPV